jgi:teichuronic acid biosynthesis glycosyltransferase TuaC
MRLLKYVYRHSKAQITIVVPSGEKVESFTGQDWLENIDIQRYHYLIPYSLEVLAKGSIVGNLKKKPWTFLMVPNLLLATAYQVLKHARKNDLIHCHWIISALFPVLFKFIHNKPVIVSVLGSDVHAMTSKFSKGLNGYILRHCDAVLTQTEDMKTELKKVNQNVHIAPTATDHEFFNTLKSEQKKELRTSLQINEDEVILLYVGMLIPVKGLELMIEAISKLNQSQLPPFRLIMLGDGIEYDNLSNKIKTFGVENKIELKGTVSHNEIRDWYQAADIFLMSSHAEGLPTVLWEASSCSLPLIATRAGQIDTIIENNKNGYVIEDRDINDYIQKCSELISNKNKRETMGDKSFELLLQKKVTCEQVAKNVINIYESLIKS